MQWIAFVWISENCTQTKQISSQNSAMPLNDSGGRDIASSILANKIRLTEQTKTIFTQRKHWLFASRAVRCYRWMPFSFVCCCVLTFLVCTIEHVKIKHLSTLHWDSVDTVCAYLFECATDSFWIHTFSLSRIVDSWNENQAAIRHSEIKNHNICQLQRSKRCAHLVVFFKATCQTAAILVLHRFTDGTSKENPK